ncbi:MAG TPA: peptidoglycan-binding domain-containing protein [Terriglobia bacterium]|nr:peptidoglycan-binding domain-containing protein [Terriglobia bacterium]
MPAMHIAPQRTEQIQQALIQAGDLHEQPTGRWDAQTRDAMKLYQQSNGFAATGLPDAKSLMKMGLGPHPLPSDVAPVAQAQPDITLPPDGSRADLSNPSPDD